MGALDTYWRGDLFVVYWTAALSQLPIVAVACFVVAGDLIVRNGWCVWRPRYPKWGLLSVCSLPAVMCEHESPPPAWNGHQVPLRQGVEDFHRVPWCVWAPLYPGLFLWGGPAVFWWALTRRCCSGVVCRRASSVLRCWSTSCCRCGGSEGSYRFGFPFGVPLCRFSPPFPLGGPCP